jgi:DNA-directed RNA polymerase specialized sigma24 family protein
MTREKLEQLRNMKQELDTLRRMYACMPAEEVGDTYGDYTYGKKQIKVIHGYSTEKNKRLAYKIKRKTIALESEVEEMEDYLNSVESPEMRDILRLYYADGLSQEEIGSIKGYSRSAITRKLQNYWSETKV